MGAEAITSGSIFDKLGAGHLPDEIIDERLKLTYSGEPVWIPRDKPGIYDYFRYGGRTGYIEIKEDKVEAYEKGSSGEYESIGYFSDVETAVDRLENPNKEPEEQASTMPVGAREVLGN